MDCNICDSKFEKQLIILTNDDLVFGFYSIVIIGVQIPVCASCFERWDKILQFLVSRFKEQKYIDEEICKKIIEYQNNSQQ